MINNNLINESIKLVENYFEANHSAKFYAWLDKLQPDWRERKQLLNEWALRLP